MRRREFLSVVGGAAAASWPVVARAQDWPTRPIRFIVPLAPGGGLDFVARVVGERMSGELGQQVVVENRTGAKTLGLDVPLTLQAIADEVIE